MASKFTYCKDISSEDVCTRAPGSSAIVRIQTTPQHQQHQQLRRETPTLPPSTVHCYSTSQLAGVIAGLCCIIGVLSVILFGTCIYYRRRLQHRLNSASSSSSLQGKRPKDTISMEIDESVRHLKLGNAAIPREITEISIDILTEIGVGKFGKVYKATLDENNEMDIPAYIVAVKIHTGETTASQRAEFFQESAVMAQLNHANIVRLVGQVVRGENLMLIEQYMEYGSLGSWLAQHGRDTALFVLLNMAGDVADGMQYLSSRGFIHRDLAARNILVGSDFQCKVSDFGLTRRMSDDGVYISHVTQIAVRWTAIEALEDNVFSTASDMWSFAIVLHEIFTFGAKPYDNAWTNHRVYHEVMGGYRLEQQRLCPDLIYQEMILAWDVDRTKRPKFDEFALSLRNASSATAVLTSSKLNFSRLKTPAAETFFSDGQHDAPNSDPVFDSDGNFIATWSFDNTEGIRINVHDASDDQSNDIIANVFSSEAEKNPASDSVSDQGGGSIEANVTPIIKVHMSQESFGESSEHTRPISPTPIRESSGGSRGRQGISLLVNGMPVLANIRDRSMSPGNVYRKQTSSTSINAHVYSDASKLQQASTSTSPRNQHRRTEPRVSMTENAPSREFMKYRHNSEDEKWTAKFLVLQGSATPNAVVAEAMESVLRRQTYGLTHHGSMMNLHLEDISTVSRPVNHDYTVLIGVDGFAIGADDDLAAPSVVFSQTSAGQPENNADDDGSESEDQESCA